LRIYQRLVTLTDRPAMPSSKVVDTRRPSRTGAKSMSSSASPMPQKSSGAVNDRRGERRRRNIPVALDRRGPVGERKAREVGERRRQAEPTTRERDHNQ